MTLTLVFMGPSRLLNFPDTLTMIIISMPILGLGAPPAFISPFPEMLERCRVSYEIEEGKN
jgi:hypothetical protein